jgi:hypothetical protein
MIETMENKTNQLKVVTTEIFRRLELIRTGAKGLSLNSMRAAEEDSFRF